MRTGGRNSDRLGPAEITGGPGRKGRSLSVSDIPQWEELSRGTRPEHDQGRARSWKSQPAASLWDCGQASLFPSLSLSGPGVSEPQSQVGEAHMGPGALSLTGYFRLRTSSCPWEEAWETGQPEGPSRTPAYCPLLCHKPALGSDGP